MQGSTLRNFLVLLLGISIVIMAGCGPKPIPKESVLDTPFNHFSQGMREFNRGNLDLAMDEFERANALDPDYAEAYAGMGLVFAAKKDFENALKSADKALDKNKNSVEARVIKGRIITKQRKGDDWIEKAVNEYKKALNVNPNSEKAYYYMGLTYKVGYQFGDAATAFSKVIAAKGDYAGNADKEWALVQKIQRAAPGTDIGMKIALIEEIDRADLAVLLIEELKLLELLEKKRPKTYYTGFKAPDDPTKMDQPEAQKLPDATDIEGHWAKNWIKDILGAKGMEAFADRTFRPDEKITRANYSVIMQNIMIMATGDESLATKFIGQPSQFPDVNASHFAYNAIALIVNRGILSVDTMSGEFRLGDHMSGADALLAIREFQNALRMTF